MRCQEAKKDSTSVGSQLNPPRIAFCMACLDGGRSHTEMVQMRVVELTTKVKGVRCRHLLVVTTIETTFAS